MSQGRAKPKESSDGQRSLAAAREWCGDRPIPARLPKGIGAGLAETAGVREHEIKAAFVILRMEATAPAEDPVHKWVEEVSAGRLSATTVAYGRMPEQDKHGAIKTKRSSKTKLTAEETEVDHTVHHIAVASLMLGPAGCPVHLRLGNTDILRVVLEAHAAIYEELAHQEPETVAGVLAEQLAGLTRAMKDGVTVKAATGEQQ